LTPRRPFSDAPPAPAAAIDQNSAQKHYRLAGISSVPAWAIEWVQVFGPKPPLPLQTFCLAVEH